MSLITLILNTLNVWEIPTNINHLDEPPKQGSFSLRQNVLFYQLLLAIVL